MEYGESSIRGHIWEGSEHNDQAGAKVSESGKKGIWLIMGRRWDRNEQDRKVIWAESRDTG